MGLEACRAECAGVNGEGELLGVSKSVPGWCSTSVQLLGKRRRCPMLRIPRPH